MKSNLNSNNQIQIRKLFVEIAQATEQSGRSAFFNWSQDQIDQALDANLFYFDELEVAAGVVRSFICFLQSTDSVEILALGVDPRFQRQGFMGKLLETFVREAQGEGLEVFLEVHEDNISAINLYKKYGFQFVNQRKSYYKDGKSALIFKTKANM